MNSQQDISDDIKNLSGNQNISNSESPTGTIYEVGYRKPPVGGRFKPGSSGNPKGRPREKDAGSVKPAVRKLAQPVTPRKRVRRIENVIIKPTVRELTLQELSDEIAHLPLEELTVC